MKRFTFLITLIVALFVGCDSYDDTFLKDGYSDLRGDVEKLDDRVTALERLCGEMNSNISSIQGILNASASGDYITGVSSVVVNGESVGYQITFKSADPLVIYHGHDGAPGAAGADGSNGADGANGKDGVTPVIGVKAYSDGFLYWTLNGAWLLDDNGNKVKAEGRDGEAGAQGPQGDKGETGIPGEPGSQGAVGVTPRLKIENGYWYVSYDNGSNWSQLGKATGEDGAAGDSMFTSIDMSNSDFVVFKLSNGSEFKLPTWSAFESLLTTCNQMNTNISSMSSLLNAIDKRDYIVSVTPLMENRVEVGYTITFANSNPITIYHGTDGSNGTSPVIGVQKHTDGIYYWTLNGSWLLDDNGNKIKAEGRDGEAGVQGPQGAQGVQGPQGSSGVTPKLKVESGYWYVSYDNGSNWSQLGKATGEDGDNIFSSVSQDSDNVYFNLSNGTTITIPKCSCSSGSGGITITWSSDATEAQKAVLRKLVNNMVLVEGGTFMMGSNDSDADSDEQPVHSVTLTNDYYIGKFEVTQEEWVAVMGDNPSNFRGIILPVEGLNWNYIVDSFLPELNRLTGLRFRLPTEAEWEFAARGGNYSQGYKYSGSNDIDAVAWYRDDNSNYKTHPVGTKQANELGLYDMSGNVGEWCSDWYSSSYYSSSPSTNPVGPSTGSGHVLRGLNDWIVNARSCRVSDRYEDNTGGMMYVYGGFRLAL